MKCALALCLSSGVHCQCWSFFCCFSSRHRFSISAPVDPMLSRTTPEPKQPIYLYQGPIRTLWHSNHNRPRHRFQTQNPNVGRRFQTFFRRPFWLLQTGRVISFFQIGVKTNSRAMNTMWARFWNLYSHTLRALRWKSNPVWTLDCVFISHGT